PAWSAACSAPTLAWRRPSATTVSAPRRKASPPRSPRCSTDAAAMIRREFTVGRVIARSGTVLVRIVPIYLLSFVVIGLPEAYGYAWIQQRFEDAPELRLVVATLFLAVLDGLATGWITAAALEAIEGGKDQWIAVRRGLAVWPQLTALYVVLDFAGQVV